MLCSRLGDAGTIAGWPEVCCINGEMWRWPSAVPACGPPCSLLDLERGSFMLKAWFWVVLAIAAVLLFFVLVAAAPAPSPSLQTAAASSLDPQSSGATIWYLGHCGYAVKTRGHFLVFDYQQTYDGRQRKSLPLQRSLAGGWINPDEIKNLQVRVFVSHSHEDHYDPVILTWKKIIPDIHYYFGWKADDDPSTNYLIGPRAELSSGGLTIATINSHHSGVPEVAWLVKVDGLVIYHNGDCLPDNPASEHDFLKTKSARIDLAFVFPVTNPGEKYTIQEEDFFRKFSVGAAFPMHATAGDAMYLDFQKVFQDKFPGLRIHVPTKLGQKFVYEDGRIAN